MEINSQDQQVTLAGKTWTLRYSVKAMLALKDAWQLKSDGEIAARLEQSKSMDDFITTIWAGMRTHHPEMSRDDVLVLLDDSGLELVKQTADNAIAAAQPRLKARPG